MKILVPFLTIFLLAPAFGMAQGTSKTDSLEVLLVRSVGDTNRVNILNLLAEGYRDTDLPKSIELATEAAQLAHTLRFSKGEVLALRNLGIAQGTNNDYGAIETLLKSSAVAERIGDMKSVARNSSLIAGAYFHKSDMAKAMEYYLKCFNVSESIHYARGASLGLAGIGNVYAKEKEFDKALESLFKSLPYFDRTKDQKEIARTNLNIGSVYREMGNVDQSIGYYETALELYDSIGYVRGAAFVLSDIGDLHFKNKKYDKSLEFLNRALAIHQTGDWPIELATDYFRLGKVYAAIHHSDEAIENFRMAIPFAEKMKMLDVLSNVYHQLAHAYKDRGNFEEALTYHELHASYYDSIFNSKKRQEMAELQTRFEAEAREKEIQILKKDKQIERIYLIAGGSAIFLASIIIILLVNRKRLRTQRDFELSKRELLLVEEQRTLTESELQRQRLQGEQLESELEYKSKELTTFALNLIQKNELLEDLKTKIAEMRGTVDDSAKANFNSLLSAVNFSFHRDKDWETFRLHFEQVHKGFFDQLLKAFPDLSANDLKVCALLKLNLGTKEMASVLDISPESVKAARYRIRKKVGATSEQNLHVFFTALEENA